MKKNWGIKLGLSVLGASAAVALPLTLASCNGDGNGAGGGVNSSSDDAGANGQTNAGTGGQGGGQTTTTPGTTTGSGTTAGSGTTGNGQTPAPAQPAVAKQDSTSNAQLWSASQYQTAQSRQSSSNNDFQIVAGQQGQAIDSVINALKANKQDITSMTQDQFNQKMNDDASFQQAVQSAIGMGAAKTAFVSAAALANWYFGSFKGVADILKADGYLTVTPKNTAMTASDDYQAVSKYNGATKRTNFKDSTLKDSATLISQLQGEYASQGIQYMLVSQQDFEATYLATFKQAAIAADGNAFKNLNDVNTWYALFLYYGLETLPKLGNYLNVAMEEKMHPWAFNMPSEANANLWAALYLMSGPVDGNIKSETNLYRSAYNLYTSWTKS